jgi:hypothetical protein
MKKSVVTIFTYMGIAIMAGCGGSDRSPAVKTAVSGAVADGYLVGATVFLDKNSNYQLDSGEPSTVTGADGTYSLQVEAADVGRYPIVAMAIKGLTIDKDNNLPVADSYLLSMPALAISGTVNSNFISPMSTILREKLAANPGMTLAEAQAQLRNQLNLPPGMNMAGDYIAGSSSGQYRAEHQTMHQVSQQMATLMAGQSDLVMTGNGANMGRYRGMMGLLNENLPQIADNVGQGRGMNSPVMSAMMTQMHANLDTTPVSSGFGNYSAMFQNMTGHQAFWNYTGGHMLPASGGIRPGGGMRPGAGMRR